MYVASKCFYTEIRTKLLFSQSEKFVCFFFHVVLKYSSLTTNFFGVLNLKKGPWRSRGKWNTGKIGGSTQANEN